MGSHWGLATISRSLMERNCFSEPNSLAAKSVASHLEVSWSFAIESMMFCFFKRVGRTGCKSDALNFFLVC